MAINAVFQFVAKNPPMAMICGGILCKLVSVLISPFNPAGAGSLGLWAIGLVVVGIVLQILWLFLFRRI